MKKPLIYILLITIGYLVYIGYERSSNKGEVISSKETHLKTSQLNVLLYSKAKQEEKILSPTTYKSNGGNSAKPKEKDKNNLWSKLKGLWS